MVEKNDKDFSQMFSIIFWGSREIFYGFFHSFLGLHKLETKEGKSRKNHWTRKFDAKHTVYGNNLSGIKL